MSGATEPVAVQCGTPLPVVAGTVRGMLLADVPVVLIGDRLTARPHPDGAGGPRPKAEVAGL